MGFILIELALLQKLILLIGNPTMTFALLLFTILVSSGIGSLLSTKLKENKTKLLSVVIIVIALIGIFYVLALPEIIYSIIDQPMPVKILISVGLLAPIGFFMGMPFPTAMRLVKEYSPRYIPWLWAINGAFSVLGAVLSVVIGIYWGASYAMILGVGIYLIALGVSYTWKKKTIEVIPKLVSEPNSIN